jgi:hypothetical protein
MNERSSSSRFGRHAVLAPPSDAHNLAVIPDADRELLLFALFPERPSIFPGSFYARMQGKRRQTVFYVMSLGHEYRPAIGTSLAS